MFSTKWFLTALGVVLLALNSAIWLNAQCDSGSSNYGYVVSQYCSYLSGCSGWLDSCETDLCSGCAQSGYIEYCVGACGEAPGCNACIGASIRRDGGVVAARRVR